MGDDAVAFAPTVALPLQQRIAVVVVRRWLSRWHAGALMVELPDRSVWKFGQTDSTRRVVLTVREWAFFWRVAAHSDVGLGESYMAGEWECDDLVLFFRLLLEQRSLARRRGLLGWTSRLGRVQGRDSAQAARDVRAHYDLGNEFFALFLDESMTYSAAVFPTSATSLGDAQRHKLDEICRRVGIAPDQDVLDIGGGWGSFAIHAARTHGCRVRTITLSAAQHALARERVRAAGLESLVDVRLCDYRDVEGRFDRIVSIEMFEALGYEQYGTFFRTCDRLLRPGGRMFLQTSTYPDADFDAYRKDVYWIQKHVFPGSLLASLDGIRRALAAHTRLRIDSIADIGTHYASTLHCWRSRFMDRVVDVRRLGFDAAFVRKWDLYLAMCQAAFAVGHVGTVQLLLVPTAPPP